MILRFCDLDQEQDLIFASRSLCERGRKKRLGSMALLGERNPNLYGPFSLSLSLSVLCLSGEATQNKEERRRLLIGEEEAKLRRVFLFFVCRNVSVFG